MDTYFRNAAVCSRRTASCFSINSTNVASAHTRVYCQHNRI
jgi:hypothetical protein